MTSISEEQEREAFEAHLKTAAWHQVMVQAKDEDDDGASIFRMCRMAAREAWIAGRAALAAPSPQQAAGGEAKPNWPFAEPKREAPAASPSASECTAPMKPSDIKRAEEILARLCDQGLVQMSIPVHQDDEDMVLARVINLAATPSPKPSQADPYATYGKRGECDKVKLIGRAAIIDAWNNLPDFIRQAPTKPPLPPIERNEQMDRTYIPLPGGWEVQTQGKGSSFRICDTKTGARWIVVDKNIHAVLEKMARDVHEAAACATSESERFNRARAALVALLESYERSLYPSWEKGAPDWYKSKALARDILAAAPAVVGLAAQSDLPPPDSAYWVNHDVTSPYTERAKPADTPYNLGWMSGWAAHGRAYPEPAAPAAQAVTGGEAVAVVENAAWPDGWNVRAKWLVNPPPMEGTKLYTAAPAAAEQPPLALQNPALERMARLDDELGEQP